MLPSHRPLSPVSECGMPLKTVRSGILTDERGVPLDDGRGTHVFVWLPALTFCPVVPRKTDKRERGGEERARVSYQSSHKVWEVSGYQPAVSFCRPHRTPVKRTDTHTSDFFSVVRMNLKEKKAWLHNRLMEWQLQKSSDPDAGCKYHLCLKDRQQFISNSLLSFFQKNMFFFSFLQVNPSTGTGDASNKTLQRLYDVSQMRSWDSCLLF